MVENLDAIESLGCVTAEVREKFAEELVRQGKLTPEVLDRIVDPSLTQLLLTDCSKFDEKVLNEVIKKAATPESQEEISPLQILKLKWCGRCVGGSTFQSMIDLGSASVLQKLSLPGLYRVPNPILINFLGASKNLECLEIPYKYPLSTDVIKAIAACSSLQELSLAHAQQVSVHVLSVGFNKFLMKVFKGSNDNRLGLTNHTLLMCCPKT